MSDRVHVDANVILRFLRNDDAKQSPLAADLFKSAQAGSPTLLASAVTLMEVFYVLATSYGIVRVDAAKMLASLLNTGAIVCEDDGMTMDALKGITSNKVSFGNAHLAASARHGGEPVASFDKGMAHFHGIALFPMEKPKSKSGPPKAS